jgi:uncharacterized protein YjiS (DUF1127 family)
MIYHYIWNSSNPHYRDILRRANEDRSASFYSALGVLRGGTMALRDAVSRLAARARRRARERVAVRELSALDDRALKDIGVVRGDIAQIAKLAAEKVSEPRPQVQPPSLSELSPQLVSAKPQRPTQYVSPNRRADKDQPRRSRREGIKTARPVAVRPRRVTASAR